MTTAAMTKAQETAGAPAGLPDMKVSVRQVFGIDSDLEVPAYSEVDPHVPDVDADYRFDRATTLAILAGFAKNCRVMPARPVRLDVPGSVLLGLGGSPV